MGETVLLCLGCGINMKQHCEHQGKIEWRDIPIGPINEDQASEEDVQPDAIIG